MHATIVQVASPGRLGERWLGIIDEAHRGAFGGAMSRKTMQRHWWFGGFMGKNLVGVAGLCDHDDSSVFLGPCVVFPPFRGRGIQRDFIRARERTAIEEGMTAAVANTDANNYASSNNLLALGYRIVGSEPEKLPTRRLKWRKTLGTCQRRSRSA